MKKSFDLTSYLKEHSGSLIVRTAACVFALVVLARLFGYQEQSLGLFRGLVIGALDMSIMFMGIKKALPYVQEPEQGLKVQKRYRYYRIASAGSIFCLMLKMNFPVAYVAGGFLLMHIFYILNLSFIACQLANSGDVKKGV